MEKWKNQSARCERPLGILAADLAELERRAAQQRIQGAIENAKRRASKLKREPTILKPYQVESALRRIGQGEAVLSITRSLHCARATLEPGACGPLTRISGQRRFYILCPPALPPPCFFKVFADLVGRLNTSALK